MLLGRNLGLIYTAAFLRSVGVGFTGVVLGIYLSRLGFSPTRIGTVVGAGLGGGALATLAVSLRADRLGRRRTLLSLSLFGALGGLGFALASAPWEILLLSFLGMLNGMGRDRGAAFALEQAIIPGAIATERRTWALAWYNLVLDAGHATGALAGAVPFVIRRWLGADPILSYRLSFGLCAALNLLVALLYSLLSREMEVTRIAGPPEDRAEGVSPRSRKVVAKLAALAGMDSFGGGFLTNALVAYWFFQRFGVSEESLGPLFFTVRVLNAGSYLAAAWLARRIGLLNTMVFTHIPSSLLLMAVPLSPSFPWAAALLLLRECLVEMDVPTRQSYIVAVVQPGERTFASGVTNLARNFAWAVASSCAGYLMQHLALASPLFVGGGTKIGYDLLLYAAFRRLKPPEEEHGRGRI